MTKRVQVFAPRENVNDEVVTIVELFAADGDFVAHDARLLLLETSKSTYEVYAPEAGYVKFLVEPQTDVPVDRALCVLCETAELAAADEPAASGAAPFDSIHSGAAASTVEPTEYSSAISPPPAAHSRHANGETEGSFAQPTATIAAAASIDAAPTAPPPSGQRASREALSLMEKFGVRIEAFSNLGLIRARDVLARVGHAAPERVSTLHADASLHGSSRAGALALREANEAAPPPAADLPAPDVPRSRKKLSRSKRTEIARLISASASLTSQVSVLAPSRGLAGRLAANPATAGQMSSRMIFEVSRLLRQFPDLNASYEPDHIVHYDEVNVGYALDIGRGLRVPIFSQADRASLEDIHRRKQDFILKYLEGALTAADLDRGTFTITDLSDSRAWTFNPLVNAQQAAILGVGGEQAIGGDRFVYPLILAFDHRLTEGLTATRFLHALSERLAAHELVLERQLGEHSGAAAPSEPICRNCRRTLSELKSLQAHLLRTVVENGEERVVCTICMDGW